MIAAPAGLRAISLDAAGTLLHPREPVARTYADAARRHGGTGSAAVIAAALPEAMQSLRSLRAGDPRWHAYWSAVVARATGVAAPELLAELYDHYAHARAWTLAEGARECIAALRDAGLRVAVLSNWDVRLRGILDELAISPLLAGVFVSAEIGADKPSPQAFAAVCAGLGVAPAQLLHVGDDDEDDVAGAVAAGCHGWRIDRDIADFATLARVVVGSRCATPIR